MSIATETTLSELIRHIVTKHHGYLRRNMPVIAAALAESGQAELSAAFDELRTELMDHVSKEESVLFPAIDRFERALASGEPLPKPYFGSVRLPLQILEQEHEIADHALERIRQLTEDYTRPAGPIADALCALDADLREHMRLENEVLFPRVLNLEM
jgi:regulator of cell morphogenesis and NO signaling